MSGCVALRWASCGWGRQAGLASEEEYPAVAAEGTRADRVVAGSLEEVAGIGPAVADLEGRHHVVVVEVVVVGCGEEADRRRLLER